MLGILIKSNQLTLIESLKNQIFILHDVTAFSDLFILQMSLEFVFLVQLNFCSDL